MSVMTNTKPILMPRHPTITITFEEPGAPVFDFTDWKPGISMGNVERAGQLMIREVQKQQAIMIQKLRIADDAVRAGTPTNDEVK